MKFVIDHDYHIHSRQSLCSGIPEQTPERILRYAQENGIRQLCLTDHFWDETVPGASNWYKIQNYEHISCWLPLPQAEGISFKFGCETDMDKFFTIGVSKENLDKFDFIIVPTTHMHMDGFTIDKKDGSLDRRAYLWVKRFAALIDADLPKRKIGIAHLNCDLIAPAAWEDHIKVLDKVTDAECAELFRGAAEREIGVELNMYIPRYSPDELERVMRLYFIAKDCGCKFYVGSDAHAPEDLDGAMEKFRLMVDYLKLEESDKFHPACFD